MTRRRPLDGKMAGISGGGMGKRCGGGWGGAATIVFLCAIVGGGGIGGEAAGEGGTCKGGVCDTGVPSLGPDALEEFVLEHQVVVVNFCDTHAGKCKLLSTEIAKARDMGGRARYAFVDSEEYPEAAQIYGVEELPTVRLFVRGRMLGDYNGRRMASDISKHAEELVRKVDEALGSDKGAREVAVELNAETFHTSTHNTSLSLFVMFYSPSCSASVRLVRDFEAVARTFEGVGDVGVAKLNVDTFPDAFGKYAKYGLPSFVLFGKADRFFGFKPKEVVYADFRVAAAMVKFLNRKCAAKQGLVKVPGMVEMAEGMEEQIESSQHDVDAPEWVFKPARGEL